MAVAITLSESLDGAAVADSLAGGGTGLDLGSVTNGAYAPLISQPSNTGKQDLYVSHDAVVDPITDFKVYIDQFSQSYGGANSAANDYTSIKSEGNTSGSSKNNGDGLSSGLWMEMDADVSTTNQFDIATRSTLVKIFGDGGTDGIDLASAFLVKADAMVYDAPGETVASAPVDGQIGKAADTVLGDSAHLAFRIYLRSAFPDGGIFQFDTIFSFAFTA